MTILRRRRRPPSTRKEVYKESTSVRERMKNASRASYRRKSKVELTSCLRSLDWFEEQAETLNVQWPNGRIAKERVLTLQQTAEVLEVSYQTLWRWGGVVMPKPILKEVETSRRRPVYHLEEVRGMITIIGEHMRKFAYLRKAHRGTITRLADTLSRTRSQLMEGHNNGKS